jgi:hypothetical protein
LYWVLFPTKNAQQNAALWYYTPPAQSPFWHTNQSLNMRMCVCFLDCHKGGLCCYLVIPIENLLRPLHLFYFHSWPIHSLSLIPLVKIWLPAH